MNDRRNPFSDPQKPLHNKPQRINDVKYNVIIRGYGPSVTAALNLPNQYAGLANIRMVSQYLGGNATSSYETRLHWGGVGPYQCDVWDQTLSTTKAIGPGQTVLLNSSSVETYGDAPSCTRILPVGPHTTKLEFWDLATGNLATFASTAYVAVQFEVTPLANKNDTN